MLRVDWSPGRSWMGTLAGDYACVSVLSPLSHGAAPWIIKSGDGVRAKAQARGNQVGMAHGGT